MLSLGSLIPSPRALITHLNEGREDQRNDTVGDLALRERCPGQYEDRDAQKARDKSSVSGASEVLRNSVLSFLQQGKRDQLRITSDELVQNIARIASLISLHGERELDEPPCIGPHARVVAV